MYFSEAGRQLGAGRKDTPRSLFPVSCLFPPFKGADSSGSCSQPVALAWALSVCTYTAREVSGVPHTEAWMVKAAGAAGEGGSVLLLPLGPALPR